MPCPSMAQPRPPRLLRFTPISGEADGEGAARPASASAATAMLAVALRRAGIPTWGPARPGSGTPRQRVGAQGETSRRRTPERCAGRVCTPAPSARTRLPPMEFHRGRLLDHVHLRVRDLDASRRFYTAAL